MRMPEYSTWIRVSPADCAACHIDFAFKYSLVSLLNARLHCECFVKDMPYFAPQFKRQPRISPSFQPLPLNVTETTWGLLLIKPLPLITYHIVRFLKYTFIFSRNETRPIPEMLSLLDKIVSQRIRLSVCYLFLSWVVYALFTNRCFTTSLKIVVFHMCLQYVVNKKLKDQWNSCPFRTFLMCSCDLA
jgi:hypothetical protein